MVRFKPNPRKGVRAAAVFLIAALSFMAQTLPPPAPVDLSSGAAQLVAFTGQISVIRSGYAWALDLGKMNIVNRQEAIVTGPDGWGQFKVADGSTFEVFPNSRVTFRANMGDWRDLLEVFLGRVRVQIEHFGGLPNNNKVHTPSAVISVRGTIFDIDVDQVETTIVTDEEGSVAVEHALRPGPAKILNRGESVTVYLNQAIGKALIDKGTVLQHAINGMRDALYQAALNGRGGVLGHAGGTASTTSPGDKNNGANTGTPPPPPAPPPPPPH